MNAKSSYVFLTHSAGKSFVHIVSNPFSSLWCQVIGASILWQLELGPHNEMHDFRIDAIGPVIEQDFDVVLASEWQAFGLGVSPVNASLEDKLQHRAPFNLDGVDELSITTKVEWSALEVVDPVGSCQKNG